MRGHGIMFSAFLWGYVLVIRRFFLQLIWRILRSKESASNFVSLLKKLLQQPTERYRKPSQIMPWAKAKLFMVQTLQGQANVCQWRRQWVFWTTIDKHNTRKWENIAKDHEAILADRRQTIHDVCEIVGLSYEIVQCILADNLNMRCISARFVPRLLSEDQ